MNAYGNVYYNHINIPLVHHISVITIVTKDLTLIDT